MLKTDLIDTYSIRSYLETGKVLLNTLPSRTFRSKEVNYPSSALQKFVKMGLLRIVSQEKELREVPLSYRERRYNDNVALYDTSNGKRLSNINNAEKGRTYEAKLQDTKEVEAVYNIYQLTFTSISQLVLRVQNELNDLYHYVNSFR